MDYNTQNNLQEDRMNNALEKFLKVVRLIIGIPVMLIMGLVAVVGAVETLKQAFAYVEVGVFPVAAVMFETCLVGMFVCLTGGAVRFAFTKANEKIPSGLFLWVGVTFFCGAVAFSIIDTNEKDNWIYMDYPPYIEEWDTQVLYKTVNCSYDTTVYFSGYFDFMTKGFRENENVLIVKDDSLTDRYRVEVHYKGLKSEMSIYTDTYSDYPKENIYIHPVDYDYDRTPEDYAYMYKYGVDFEYGTPLAIEKIIIRTAYPEQIDISDINS